MNKQEQLRVHLLGALRSQECPSADSDLDKLADFLSEHVSLQVEGIGWVPDRKPGWWVNVYAVERHYGGPEEGGWWFNAGTPVASFEYDSREEAEAAVPSVEEKFKDMAHGNIYSVRGGVQIDVNIEDLKGEPWPKETPHYE